MLKPPFHIHLYPDTLGLPFVEIHSLSLDNKVCGLLHRTDGGVRQFIVKSHGDKFLINTHGGSSGSDNAAFYFKNAKPGMPKRTNPPPARLWMPPRDGLSWDLYRLRVDTKLKPQKRIVESGMRGLLEYKPGKLTRDQFYYPFEAVYTSDPYGAHVDELRIANSDADSIMRLWWISVAVVLDDLDTIEQLSSTERI